MNEDSLNIADSMFQYTGVFNEEINIKITKTMKLMRPAFLVISYESNWYCKVE